MHGIFSSSSLPPVQLATGGIDNQPRTFGMIVYVCVYFTVTDRASTVPSSIRDCQSGLWSRRGTKVNGPHRGDNPLLKPRGIQIAT